MCAEVPNFDVILLLSCIFLIKDLDKRFIQTNRLFPYRAEINGYQDTHGTRFSEITCPFHRLPYSMYIP